MRVVRSFLWAAAAAAIAVAGWGCAKLVGADFDDPSVAPGRNPGCTLPTSGDARVRLADFAPSIARFDFCLTPAGAATPAQGILASSGDSCPSGIGYEQVLAPFAVASGSYRVDAVPAGQGCVGAAAASVTFTATAGQGTTIALAGDPAHPTLVALPETPATAGAYQVRPVHALTGPASLDFDLVADASLPASVVRTLAAAVRFGAAPATGTGIDAHGYLRVDAPVSFGAAVSGSGTVSIATTPSLAPGGSYSLFAAGDPTDPSFPPELFVCDETASAGLFTTCGNQPALDVAFETYDPALAGVFGDIVSVRHDPVIAAMRNPSADVLCVTEVESDEDKRAIADAARGTLPYAAWFPDTLDTKVDDPRDAQGQVPTPPSGPWCTPAWTPTLDNLFSCLEQRCGTPPNDGTSHLTDDPETCFALGTMCSPSVIPFFATNDSVAKGCWMCAISQLENYSSFADVRSRCSERTSWWPISWNGQGSVVLLSRYPITASEQLVLPSTIQRGVAVRAELSVGNDARLDAYCTNLTAPPATAEANAILPYTGGYGGWPQELTLQTKQLTRWVAARSAARGRRAVVLGHMNTGPSIGGAPPQNPDALATLQQSLAVAAPPGYAPRCTLCIDNPLVSPTVTGSNLWPDLALVSGIAVTDVKAAQVVETARVLSVDGGAPVPLSLYYGYRAVISVHP